MDEYPMDSKWYQLGEEIGIGMRSVVHKAHCISNNSVVAIKIIEFQKSVEDMERVANKAKNMAGSVTHPNILKPHCVFTVANSSLWVVMPFLSGGSVLSITARTRANTGAGMSHEYIAALLKGICSALCHLHHLGQMHGDIKPGNILVDSDGSVKLGDLGFSASVCGSDDLMELETTPLYWVAPEMVYSISSDIWSFGITALELAHGAPPLSFLPPGDSMAKRVNRRFGFVDRFHFRNVGGEIKIPFPFPGSFKNMVALCLNSDELSRPSAEELMEHDFFKKNCQTPEYFINRFVKDSQSRRANVKLGIVGWELDEERFEMKTECVEGTEEVELLHKVVRKKMEFQKMKRKLEMTLGRSEVELLHNVLKKNMEFDKIKRKLEMNRKSDSSLKKMKKLA